MKVKVDYIEDNCRKGRYREEWFEEFESVAEMVTFMKGFEERFPNTEVTFYSDGTLSISKKV